MSDAPTRRAALLAGTFFALAAGCSSEVTRYPVSGTVTIDGAPAALATIKFTPVGGDSKSGGTGRTDDAGKFSIGEDGKNTGLPAGEYKVTFTQTLINGKPALGGSGGKKTEKLAGEKEGVPDESRDPAATPHAAKVGRGSTSFAFDIKKKK